MVTFLKKKPIPSLKMIVNDTRDYYGREGIELGSELTTSTQISAHPSITNFGLPYGEILCEAIIERFGAIHGARVLEIGGGLANVAREFTYRLWTEYEGAVYYSMLDISPEFVECQKEAMAAYRLKEHIQGDAHYLRDHVKESVDIVICNEVVGDLVTIDKVPYGAWLQNPFRSESAKRYWLDQASGLIQKYGILVDSSAKRLAFNVGAMMLVEQICDVLKPGGVAFISEYSCERGRGPDEFYSGNLDPSEVGDLTNLSWLEKMSFPGRAELIGHTEYSVKFSHLEQIAKAKGMQVERGSIYDLMQVKSDVVKLPEGVLHMLLDHFGIKLKNLLEHGEHPYGVMWRMLTDPDLFFEVTGADRREFDRHFPMAFLPMREYFDAQEFLFVRKVG